MNKTELLEKYKDTLLKVVYRNGYERYLLDGKLYAPNGEQTYRLCFYDEDLKDNGAGYNDKDFDIMKIFSCDDILLWERVKEKPILTPFEKELLKVFGKNYKYICREDVVDNDLFLSVDEHICADWWLLSEFNTLFTFIRQGEYYNIKELLED